MPGGVVTVTYALKNGSLGTFVCQNRIKLHTHTHTHTHTLLIARLSVTEVKTGAILGFLKGG